MVDYAMRTRVDASAPDKKRHISTAHVDVTLRLGRGPGSDGFDEAAIASMAGWLGLRTAIVERAKEVFRKMEADMQAWAWIRCWTKLRSNEPLYTACLSIACRNEGSPRSLKELASAMAKSGAAARVEISRLTKYIRRRLGEEVVGRATGVGVSGYMRRFCQQLDIGDREAPEANEAARRLEESGLEVPHNGESIVAGIVCLALERANADRPDVHSAVAAGTGVSTVTINRACEKLRLHAELLWLMDVSSSCLGLQT